MNPILEKLLKRRGIKSVDELHENEKETFDKWERILSDGEITIEKVLAFCDSQLQLIDDKFKNIDNTAEKNNRLIIYRTVYKALRDLITSPAKERENLEKFLSTLLN